MKLLLDTHALLWAMTDSARLSPRVRAALADRGNELLVSPASGWEIATRVRIGKLPGIGDLPLTLPRQILTLGATQVPITVSHALLAGSLTWANRDPFDRMVAAQSMSESALLVTVDEAFEQLPGIAVYW